MQGRVTKVGHVRRLRRDRPRGRGARPHLRAGALPRREPARDRPAGRRRRGQADRDGRRPAASLPLAEAGRAGRLVQPSIGGTASSADRRAGSVEESEQADEAEPELAVERRLTEAESRRGGPRPVSRLSEEPGSRRHGRRQCRVEPTRSCRGAEEPCRGGRGSRSGRGRRGRGPRRSIRPTSSPPSWSAGCGGDPCPRRCHRRHRRGEDARPSRRSSVTAQPSSRATRSSTICCAPTPRSRRASSSASATACSEPDGEDRSQGGRNRVFTNRRELEWLEELLHPRRVAVYLGAGARSSRSARTRRPCA